MRGNNEGNNEEINEDISNLTKRALFFMKEKISVHIKLKTGFFYNGLIMEVAENEFIILLDRMYGETPVFFTEMLKIEKMRLQEDELQ